MNYNKIAKHYEECLLQHGDTSLGVDWPNEKDAKTRHSVMLGIKTQNCSLLDFGCGSGHLLDTINNHYFGIKYIGLDINQKSIDLCLKKFPDNKFICQDVLKNPLTEEFDYIICNGVFNEKLDLSYDEMFAFLESVVSELWKICKVGLAFNVMNKHVDWERDDLFHVPFDQMADLCKRRLSRHFQFRSDYGLYEYTVFVFKEPQT